MGLTYSHLIKLFGIAMLVAGCSQSPTTFKINDPTTTRNSLEAGGLTSTGQDIVIPPTTDVTVTDPVIPPVTDPVIPPVTPPTTDIPAPPPTDVVVTPPPVTPPTTDIPAPPPTDVVITPDPVTPPPVTPPTTDIPAPPPTDVVVNPPPVTPDPVTPPPVTPPSTDVPTPPICSAEQTKLSKLTIKVAAQHSDHKKLRAQSVFINISRIEISFKMDGKNQTISVGENTGMVDLMNLQGGLLIPTQDLKVPVGAEIYKLRLILNESNNFVVTANRDRCDMKTPSASQSGLKLQLKTPVKIVSGSSYDVVLGFDPEKSVVVRGDDDDDDHHSDHSGDHHQKTCSHHEKEGCLLKPVIKLVSFMQTPDVCTNPETTDDSEETNEHESHEGDDDHHQHHDEHHKDHKKHDWVHDNHDCHSSSGNHE